MTIQVKELIDKIKNEGVMAAEIEAEKIIAEAEKKAAQIIQDARVKAESYKSQAEKEIKKQEAAGQDALKQGARDILIGLEKQIIKLFEAVISDEVNSALTPALTEKLITDLAHAWAEKGEESIRVVLSSQDAKELEAGLQAKLSRHFKKGVEIFPSQKVTKGFRIGGSDGALYNFTEEGIAEVFAETLSPALAATVKEAIE